MGATTSVTGYSTELEASSVYYGFGAGFGYSFFGDKVSASAGVRYTTAERSGKIAGTMNFNTAAFGGAWSVDLVDDYEYTAAGFTPIFGLDIRPVDKLTVGFRYEMETELEFKYKTNEVSATPSTAAATAAAAMVKSMLPDYDGMKVNQNLPQVISVGAEYVFTPAFSATLGSSFYLLNLADLSGGEDSYGLGFEIGGSVQYKASDKLALGGTFMHTRQNVEQSLWDDDNAILTVSANPSLDSLYFGLGAQYEVLKNLDIQLCGAWVYYIPEETTTDNGLEVTYNKQVINMGITLKYKL
jgi:hypothetical protein